MKYKICEKNLIRKKQIFGRQSLEIPESLGQSVRTTAGRSEIFQSDISEPEIPPNQWGYFVTKALVGGFGGLEVVLHGIRVPIIDSFLCMEATYHAIKTQRKVFCMP